MSQHSQSTAPSIKRRAKCRKTLYAKDSGYAVSRLGLDVGLVSTRTSVPSRSGSPFSSKFVVCGYCLNVTLCLVIHETVNRLSPLLISFNAGVVLVAIVTVMGTLRAPPLSGTFLQTLPDLVTPLKGHSLFPRSCPATRSAPSERFGY